MDDEVAKIGRDAYKKLVRGCDKSPGLRIDQEVPAGPGASKKQELKQSADS